MLLFKSKKALRAIRNFVKRNYEREYDNKEKEARSYCNVITFAAEQGLQCTDVRFSKKPFRYNEKVYNALMVNRLFENNKEKVRIHRILTEVDGKLNTNISVVSG